MFRSSWLVKWLQSDKTTSSGFCIAYSSCLTSFVKFEIILNGVGVPDAGLKQLAFSDGRKDPRDILDVNSTNQAIFYLTLNMSVVPVSPVLSSSPLIFEYAPWLNFLLRKAWDTILEVKIVSLVQILPNPVLVPDHGVSNCL